MCAMTHSYVCHDSFVCVPWLIHTRAMTHSYLWHDSFIRAPWIVHMDAITRSYVCYGAFTCVPWLVHTCALTHSYLCPDSFIRVPWLIHMCAMAHSYVCHDLCTYVPWIVHMSALTQSYVSHGSFICVPWPIRMCAMTHLYVCPDSFICVPWLIHMCAITRSHECHVSSKYSIKNKSHHHVRKYFPILCLENRRMHHHCMRAPPHSLHWLYLPVLLLLLLSANLCVYHIAYAHTRTPLFGEPPHHPKHTQREFQFVCLQPYRPKQKNSHKNYLGLYARVSRHLIMACSKGTEKGKEAEDNQPNARICVHGDNPRYTCEKLTSLFVFSSFICSLPNMWGGGTGGTKSWGACVCGT